MAGRFAVLWQTRHMGFDMKVLGTVSAEHRRVLTAAVSRMVEVSKQSRDSPGWLDEQAQAVQAVVDASVGTFSADLSMMSGLLSTMDSLGMVAPSRATGVEPYPEHYGVSAAAAYEAEVNGGPIDEAMAHFLAARTAYLSNPGHDGMGIGLHKFSSGRGWIVTPREVASALAVAQAKPPVPGVLVPGWERWLAFLGVAERSGGFRVL